MLFLFNDPPTPEIYTLSLHDALPIWRGIERLGAKQDGILRNHQIAPNGTLRDTVVYSIIASEWPTVKAHLTYQLNEDRKSTRLNSSHRCISYAVFCLKKKNYKRTSHT